MRFRPLLHACILLLVLPAAASAQAPRLPGAFTAKAVEVEPTRATLAGSVDPNGSETNAYFEFGRTQNYGNRTPGQSVGNGDQALQVRAPVSDLEPNTRYHYRVVANNAAGTRNGKNRTFVTPRAPTGIAVTLDPSRVVWGHGPVVNGRVTGGAVGGITVALERQDFPFNGPFSSIGMPAPVRADRNGNFRFQVGGLFSTTHIRAITRSRVIATSPAVRARVEPRVGLITRRRDNGGTLFRGSINPELPDGRASLQRQAVNGGRWIRVERDDLSPMDGDRSRYSFRIRRKRSDRTYRVAVTANDGGAHVTGYSRHVTIEGRRR